MEQTIEVETLENFDTLVGTCPHCHKKAETQTKLGPNTMQTIAAGSDINLFLDIEGPKSFILECKNPCGNCKQNLNAKIVDNKFVGFKKTKAKYQEGLFVSLT